jgi:hypothetical protein
MKKSGVIKKPKGAAGNGKRSTATKSQARSKSTKVVLLSGGNPQIRGCLDDSMRVPASNASIDENGLRVVVSVPLVPAARSSFRMVGLFIP